MRRDAYESSENIIQTLKDTVLQARQAVCEGGGPGAQALSKIALALFGSPQTQVSIMNACHQARNHSVNTCNPPMLSPRVPEDESSATGRQSPALGECIRDIKFRKKSLRGQLSANYVY
jgi:hypothetical protein